MHDLQPVLAEQQFLAGLSENHLALITGCASNVRFDAGDYIFREGGAANHFYLVRHGSVAIELHDAKMGIITVETIGEGDVLGWSWLFAPYKWHFNARAMTLTRALAIDGACLRGKCDDDHELGYQLMSRFAQVIVQRLQSTRLQVLDIYA